MEEKIINGTINIEKSLEKDFRHPEKTAINFTKRHLSRKRFSRFMRVLGPGLITGAADDDPSGIATYSQAGASYGYSLLWVFPLYFPCCWPCKNLAPV
jgi:hypothetical protein